MNNHIFIYIVLFFVYLFLHTFLDKHKENFDNKKNSIVLIGDSILENTNYVQEYYNVESSIKQQHYNVINLAKDNATIEDVKTQLYFLDKKLRSRARKHARMFIFKKLTKGKNKSELSFARRAEIEKRMNAPAVKKRIDMFAKRMFKDVRKKEVERKKG